MFEYIKGTLENIYEDRIVIENNGIAYRVYVSAQDIGQLPKAGNAVRVYLHMNIKEDNITLYGFVQSQDRDIYRRLISVSSVGPKVAMGILSTFSTREIIASIISNDVAALTKAPGIGKKTAQRIILELKDKLKSGNELFEEGNVESVQRIEMKDEAAEALVALGYQPSLANKAINAVFKEGIAIETLIKKALKLLADH